MPEAPPTSHYDEQSTFYRRWLVHDLIAGVSIHGTLAPPGSGSEATPIARDTIRSLIDARALAAIDEPFAISGRMHAIAAPGPADERARGEVASILNDIALLVAERGMVPFHRAPRRLTIYEAHQRSSLDSFVREAFSGRGLPRDPGLIATLGLGSRTRDVLRWIPVMRSAVIRSSAAGNEVRRIAGLLDFYTDSHTRHALTAFPGWEA